MKTYKSKHTFIIFFLLTLSLNIFAQQKAERLPVYETTLNLSKIYKQGEIILLGENDDIRIYSSSNHQTENSVAINPVNPNNIIVQTNGRNIYDGNGNYITTHQTYFYTTDGGINWSGSEDNPNGIYTRGDPVALFDYYGNAFYITLGNPGGIYVLKSTDGGASWGSTVNADPLNSSGDDKEHAAADISGTYPNNIYIAWTDFSTTNKDVVLTRSTNGGSSFEGTRKILYSGADRGQGTNIAIGPNGEVYIAFANYTNGYLPESGIRFIKSTNGGSTFLTANIAFTISGIRTSNIGLTEFNNTRVNSYPSMGVDRSNGSRRGWIYIVYADKNTGDADIYLRRSTNGGLTWSSAIRVNSDPVSNGKQQWFPSIDVDQVTGKIYVSYYNMDSTGYLTSRYVAVSENGGDSFVCKRISDVRFTPSALGAGYADGYMGDYYETAVYNSRLYPTWSDNRAGNFQAFISPYGGIKVDQLLSDNTTHIGNVGNWNGSQFVDYQIPVSFDFSVGSNPVLRGSQAIMSNQKYNNWNYDNDVTNHRSFLITPGTVELISKFQSTNSGITIKNSLEGTSVSGGNIDFKDPWLIDYTDPLYGNNIRSQGMNAPFKTRTSPFYPDTSTSYNGDVYKGVFLNQGLPNWAPPYYSVEAQSPQNINLGGALGTHKFYFQNWSGTGVSYQYPNSLQTPVVFTSSNAKAQAVMKGTQLSNNINAFSNSSQRKFVRTTDGNLWMVYESMKKVWLEKSTDNGATWDIMNNGKALSDKESKSPSIDYEFGTIGVVFQEKYGNSYKIIFQYFYTNGTIFNSYTVEDSSGFIYPDPYGFDSQPVIAWSTNGKFLVVWREKNNPGLHYRLGAVNQFIWGVEWYTASGLIDNTDGKSKNASVAVLKSGTSSNFHLAWEQGPSYEKIKYYKINVNSDNTISFSDYYEVSSPTGYGIGIQPVIVVKNDNNPMIIYKLGGGNGGYSNDIVRREKYSYGWSSVEMIYLPNRLISSASLGYADDGTYVTFFTDNWNKVWYKRSYWSTGPYQISGLTAQDVQTSNWNSMGSMKAMSYNHSSAPYIFKLTPNAAPQKVNTERIFTQQVEAIVNKDSVYFLFNFGDILQNGEPVKFAKIDTDIRNDKQKKGVNNLITETFTINKGASLLIDVKYFLSNRKKAFKLLGNKGYVKYKMELVDAANQKVLSTLKAVNFDKDNIPENTTKYYSFNTEGLENKEVKIQLKIENNIDAKIYYAKVFTFRDKGELSKLNYETVDINGAVTIKDYALLQNYPNPFNPSTTINYQLPKAGVVTLKIYDILGREVKTLVNDFKAKGRYSVSFNAGKLASGVYIYRLKVNNFSSVKKLLLLK